MVERFLAVEPHPLDRIEIVLAQLCAMTAQIHSRKGASPPKVSEFLPYREAWKRKAMSDRYSEADLELMKALGA